MYRLVLGSSCFGKCFLKPLRDVFSNLRSVGISMALKSGVFASFILASSLSCTVMAQRHTGRSKNVGNGKDSVNTTSEPDQNTLNVQIEKLQAWNFSKYAKCAVRQRPASMGELPIEEEEYVVLAERALKIWYAAILAQPMKKQKLDISIHFWQFCLLHCLAWFFRSVFGARNFAWVQKLRNYSPAEELDLVWHCHILDMRNYADFQQQLGTEIGHVPCGDEETNDLAQYLGCFSYFFPILPFSIYIYISSFVFHLLIILSFLSVRPIYSSELCLECMLLLSCLEGFTMLVVVVSFFSSI